MKDEIFVVLKTIIQDDPSIVRIGTEEECKSFMFDKTMPRDYRRNIVNIDTEYSCFCIGLEEMISGKWVKIKYSFLKYHEEN